MTQDDIRSFIAELLLWSGLSILGWMMVVSPLKEDRSGKSAELQNVEQELRALEAVSEQFSGDAETLLVRVEAMAERVDGIRSEDPVDSGWRAVRDLAKSAGVRIDSIEPERRSRNMRPAQAGVPAPSYSEALVHCSGPYDKIAEFLDLVEGLDAGVDGAITLVESIDLTPGLSGNVEVDVRLRATRLVGSRPLEVGNDG